MEPGCRDEEVGPLLDRRAIGVCVILGVIGAVDFLELNIAARLGVRKGLLEQARPVLDTAYDVARVDVVERTPLVRPCFLYVVNLETEIWRDPSWLDWTEVIPDNLYFVYIPESTTTSTISQRMGTTV